MASCRVGAVDAARDGGDVSGEGFGVVRGVQCTGTPAGFHPAGEPVPGRSGSGGSSESVRPLATLRLRRPQRHPRTGERFLVEGALEKSAWGPVVLLLPASLLSDRRGGVTLPRTGALPRLS